MRCISTIIALLVAGICATPVVQAQHSEIDNYLGFLATHRQVTGERLLTEYPSVLFKKEAALPASNIAYLDSVILKYNLTADEQALLQKNGFLVTERESSPNPFFMYNDIWNMDLPVLVTSDAILYAVHMSFDEILKYTESRELSAALKQTLNALWAYQPVLEQKYGQNPAMQPMLYDLDIYIAVARNLVDWIPVQPYYDTNDPLVKDILSLIEAQQPASIALFSETPRDYDFSQFTPRGHYADDWVLETYFKTFMWIGRTEFMLTRPVQQGSVSQSDADIKRQTIDALLLCEAVRETKARENLDEIEEYLAFLVGESDNVTIAGMEEVAAEAGVLSPADVLDDAALARFQHALSAKSFAVQRINSQILMSDPMSPKQVQPPSAFMLMGQRFILDSYILGNVVFDRILDNGVKVPRMLPSSMDMLFALGNNAAGQFIQDDLNKYRYGLNLAGLRYLVDGYEEDYWQETMYSMWLNSIRSLKAPDDLTPYPEFMKTAAWWQQKMNTQLASWAQLRHDYLLYAKPSYSGGGMCSYPEGYVEPVPELYRRLSLWASQGKEAYVRIQNGAQSQESYFFTRFAVVMDSLTEIADLELRGEKLAPEYTNFIKRMLQTRPSCPPALIVDGWYKDLYFTKNYDLYKPVVADIHTAPTDEIGNPVGWVMHAGTGNFNLGVVLAPSVNGGLTAYCGPMMSYYEHVTMGFERLTDEEWTQQIGANAFFRPDWTHAYLAGREGQIQPIGPVLKTLSDAETSPTPIPSQSAIRFHTGFPNPVSAGETVLFGFSVQQDSPSHITMSVYDVAGRKVAMLFQESLASGTYFKRWNVTDTNGGRVAPGMYICRLSGGGEMQTRSVAVVE